MDITINYDTLSRWRDKLNESNCLKVSSMIDLKMENHDDLYKQIDRSDDLVLDVKREIMEILNKNERGE